MVVIEPSIIKELLHRASYNILISGENVGAA